MKETENLFHSNLFKLQVIVIYLPSIVYKSFANISFLGSGNVDRNLHEGETEI